MAPRTVSIHAPRVGCDGFEDFCSSKSMRFNSRTPCGVRLQKRFHRYLIRLFQFTHPVWGATKNEKIQRQTSRFQFTHPVWGATASEGLPQEPSVVSIHAPRVGCDAVTISLTSLWLTFQFTHPVWGATLSQYHLHHYGLRFNSRTPCGVRPVC